MLNDFILYHTLHVLSVLFLEVSYIIPKIFTSFSLFTSTYEFSNILLMLFTASRATSSGTSTDGQPYLRQL